MSDEIFNFIELQFKQSGITYWACRPCTTFAQGMNHRIKQMAEEMEEIRSSCEKNDSGLQKLQGDVGNLAQKMDKQEKRLDEAAAKSASSNDIFEELRERESKRLNLMMYGMREAPAELSGLERWDWDLQSCGNLFSALKLNLQRDCIKFCRRVGEAGSNPRPMVVGFYDEGTKARVLRCDTRRSAFSHVEVGPDQTKKQKTEELEMKSEAVRRNRAMGDEDRAKNLAWLVVGPRGEKRLVKKYVSLESERRYPSSQGRRDQEREEGSQDRGLRGVRGRGIPIVAMPLGTGANSIPLGRDQPAELMEEEVTESETFEESEEEEVTEGTVAAVRTRGRGRPPLLYQKQRLNSKRKEMEEAPDTLGEPATKH